MKEFFTKKRIVIISILAVLTIIMAVTIGVSLSNTKTKQKLAEKASVERSVEEKKKAVSDVGDIKKKIDKTEEEAEEEQYTDEYIEYEKLSEDEKKNVEVIPRKKKVEYEELKVIKKNQEKDLGKKTIIKDEKEEKDDSKEKDETPDNKNNEEKNDNQNEDEEREDDKNVEVLPAKFDLRDKIDIKIENQNPYGLCWAFASLTALETNLALKKGEYYDFSESHLDYTTSRSLSGFGREANNGGSFDIFRSYSNMNNGFVLDETIPFGSYADYEYNTFYTAPTVDVKVTKTVSFPAYNKYKFEESQRDEAFKEYQAVLKTHIMNYGSLYAYIEASYGSNCYYGSYEERAIAQRAHAVSIIGWDDNYSKDNFVSITGLKPSHDGAYIAANSWGEDWGENGYFYISYDDVFVHTDLNGIMSTDEENLINLNKMNNKELSKYIKNSYYDQIIDVNGVKYLNPESLIDTYILDLSNIGLTSLEDVEYLSGPTRIDLSGNKLESIEGIQNILVKDTKSYSIDLSNNNIKDVSILKDFNVSTLTLNGNKNVTGYESIKSLKYLELSDCSVTNIDNLAELKDLYVLDLSNNSIENYDKLSEITLLLDLNLSGNDIQDLTELSSVLESEHVHTLDLSNNRLKNLSGIENAVLYSLDLSGNSEIEDFEALRNCNELTYIGLRNCNIKDASEIKINTNVDSYINEYYEELVNNSNAESKIARCEEEGMDIIYDVGYDFWGVLYDLSDNHEIYNIETLNNAFELILKNCNIKDISKLSDIRLLEYVDLSGNKELSGTYTGESLNYLALRDCNLSEDFDFFGIKYINELDIRNNNIQDYSKVLDRILASYLYVNRFEGEEQYINDTYIYADEYTKKIAIPNNGNSEINTKDLIYTGEIISYYNLSDGEKNYRNAYAIIPITSETKLKVNSFSNKTIEFYVDKSMKNDGIMITKKPDKIDYTIDETFNSKGMKVANTYSNCVQENTNDYEIGNIYTLEMNKSIVDINQDEYKTYLKINVEGAMPSDDELLDEDITPPDGFEEEFPTLTFKTDEMYNIAKEYWKDHTLSYDDEFRTIILNEYRELNDSLMPMYIPRRLLSDIEGLKPMIVTDIYILFGEEDGNELIAEEDLAILSKFKDLSEIHIITWETDVSKIIVDQEKYNISIEQGVG